MDMKAALTYLIYDRTSRATWQFSSTIMVTGYLKTVKGGAHLRNILHEVCLINILRATYLQLSAH